MTNINTARRGGKSRLTNILSPTPSRIPGPLPRLRYSRPDKIGHATPWGKEWFMSWQRNCGTVYVDMETGELCALYCKERDPADRNRLKAAIEARKTGVAEVIAAVDAHWEQHDHFIERINRAHADRRAAQ
jgi:hypothetical protein